MVEAHAVVALVDDEAQKARPGHVGGQGPGCVGRRYGTGVGDLVVVGPQLEDDDVAVAVADLVVDTHLRRDRRARLAGVVDDLRVGVRAQTLGEGRALDRQRLAVTGRLLAVALVALDRSPAVAGTRPGVVTELGAADRQGRDDEDVVLPEALPLRVPSSHR